MKVYTKMPKALQPFYQEELTKAVVAFKKGHYMISWRHLERAHILAQPYPCQHTTVHWRMFLFGIKVKNWKEVMGQIPRLLVGGIKSFVGNIPVGNTGGANVPPLLPMEIAKDLAEIINNTKTK
ncbi:DUF3703 domain-containing protein [Sediminibacterium sp.]|uniref:DUF3703 domain-containing protein n=1 Tax=Sediminibacterium sp. TaxID=1917865 RepID=UPI002733F98F|nr:DUF3703 domain-containing protein [Sediminibacterium sp.]MDP3393330.1 DUF3703 domain-containing protein [Sediminibacterium sp.]MDP3567932.1 DUF3703 domain-containing protein [Sediminibacterium sp.]